MLLVKTMGGSLMYPEYPVEKKDTTDISDISVKDESCSQTLQKHVS